jgi:hypothetical protein
MRKQIVYTLGFLFILNACFGMLQLFYNKHGIILDFAIYLFHSFALFMWVLLIINTFKNEN